MCQENLYAKMQKLEAHMKVYLIPCLWVLGSILHFILFIYVLLLLKDSFSVLDFIYSFIITVGSTIQFLGLVYRPKKKNFLEVLF